MKTRWMMAALALAAGATAQAQTQEALYIKSLAATCANCHGTDGKAVKGSSVPTIAGMPREYLLTQLKLFKDGTRRASIMHQLASGYTDQQLEQIATYMAAQKAR